MTGLIIALVSVYCIGAVNQLVWLDDTQYKLRWWQALGLAMLWLPLTLAFCVSNAVGWCKEIFYRVR